MHPLLSLNITLNNLLVARENKILDHYLSSPLLPFLQKGLDTLMVGKRLCLIPLTIEASDKYIGKGKGIRRLGMITLDKFQQDPPQGIDLHPLTVPIIPPPPHVAPNNFMLPLEELHIPLVILML